MTRQQRWCAKSSVMRPSAGTDLGVFCQEPCLKISVVGDLSGRILWCGVLVGLVALVACGGTKTSAPTSPSQSSQSNPVDVTTGRERLGWDQPIAGNPA